MGRQFRSPRRGTGGVMTAPYVIPSTLEGPAATTGHTISIPNYGITDLSTFAAGEYTMDAPEAGVRKTLVRAVAGSSGVVVRFSTGKTVSAGTLATTAATQVTFNATNDCCIVLIGQNSTHWFVESMWSSITNTPASGSTGIVLAGT